MANLPAMRSLLRWALEFSGAAFWLFFIAYLLTNGKIMAWLTGD